VRIEADLALGRAAWDRAREAVRAHFAQRPELAVADLKESLGISRKYAVPLLETLDRAQITVRNSNVRTAGPKLAATERARP
jgi:selenocysteine-specific elongation factor